MSKLSTRGHAHRRWFAIPAGASIAALALAGCSSGTTSSTSSSSAPAGTTSATASNAATTAITSIFGPGGDKAGQGQEISIGMDLAITGNNAFVGKVMKQGAELAAAQIAAAGGPTFKISIADHKGGDVAAGVSGAQRLINENQIAVMLSSYGNVTAALVPLMQQNKILTFNGGGPDPSQASKDFLWLPANYWGDGGTPAELAYLHQKYPNAKTIAEIGQTENGINAFNNLVPQDWKKLTGGDVVAKETIKVGDTDYSQLVARVKSANPDVIWTSAYGADPGYIVKALRQAGVTAPVIGQELTDTACQVAGDTYGTYLFGGSYFSPQTADSPFAKLYADTYQATYNEPAEYYGATYYEDVFLVWDLVKRVIASGGDVHSGADLQKAIASDPKFKTLIGGTTSEVGSLSLDPTAHTGARPMGIYSVEYSGGKCTPVKVADATAVPEGGDPSTSITLTK